MASKSPMNAEIKDIAAAICEKNELSAWNQKAHVGLILSLAKRHGMPADRLPAFAASLEHKGVGGNASQFAQALVEEGILEKRESATGIASQYVVD